ncbi:MAG: HIT domain-containing protein [Asgard group archaeon]|nr:HIT domain-containing protein [Asgard group archaeon]
MHRLWAPWRMEYIEQPKDDDECFLCDAINDIPKNDRKNLILFRGDTSFVILNKYPYIAGHLMVAPKIHVSNLEEIDKKTSDELWDLLTKTVILMKKTIQPEGFNIGLNLGAIAGAGLRTHLHFHVVPRWLGDTNFMPILTNTRVISQELIETFDVLYKKVDIFKK